MTTDRELKRLPTPALENRRFELEHQLISIRRVQRTYEEMEARTLQSINAITIELRERMFEG